MLEFLKETTPDTLAKNGEDVERSLRLHNSATPMSSFFELAFKEIYKNRYKISSPLQLQRGQNAFNLNYLINDNSFWAFLCGEYSLTPEDRSIINEIRKTSNYLKHEGGQTPLEEDVRKWFKCLFVFSSKYYAQQTGKPAPEWSDLQYEKLYQNAISSSEQQTIIADQRRRISDLTEESNRTNNALQKAEKENEDLKSKIDRLKDQPNASKELVTLKADQKRQLEKIDGLQKQLEEARSKIKEANERIAQVSPVSSDEKSNSFKESAIQAASVFYDYLAEKEKRDVNNSGKEICRAGKIERDEHYKDRIVYCLYLDKNPKSIDNVRIVIGGKQYEEYEIKPLKCNKAKVSLHVSVSKGIADPFISARAEDVCVVSDMRFLIKNVLQWYKLFGDKTRLPTTAPGADNRPFPEIPQKPTKDQADAISGVMTYPFSYVWGAPGTGKTQFVLSRSVLNYIKENKRILVTAPTNNALDQTLKGLIEVFDKAGIDFNEIVFRYGMPTHELATKYPRICEDYGLKKSIEEIDDYIEAAREERDSWKKAYDLLPQYLEFMKMEESFHRFENAFPDFQMKLNSTVSKLADDKKALREAQAKQEETQRRINNLNYSINKAAAKEAKLRNLVERDSILKRIGLIDSDKLSAKLSHTVEEIQEIESQIEKEKSALSTTKDSISLYQEKIGDSLNAMNEDREELVAMLELWPDIARVIDNATEESLNSCLEEVVLFANRTKSSLSGKKEEYRVFEGKDLNAVQAPRWLSFNARIKELESKKSALLQNAASNNPDSCLVVAATVDKVISTFDPETTSFSHIFLDEAGYCPLIKGMVLTAFRCPLTLLGDHMQLPPVCEFDQAKMAEKVYMPITLFAQSALYIENAFVENIEALYRNYTSNADPHFKEMHKYPLIQSHRFGPQLARVLDDAVYRTGFRGDPKVNTAIYYINAPKHSDSTERISESELIAIDKYLSNMQGTKQDIGILTPYTKMGSQVWKLKRIAASKGVSRDDVMNVHKSQGREWDTVLFSVVDTTKMYFTDSTNKKAKSLQLINTAVSRARKELIIVCDYDYWIRQKNQLIGKLLSVAEEYPHVKL